MKKIAIMQPYFYPYAGYFRLISQSDLFVIYDCVQFQRRGYVHRSLLQNESGTNPKWLTLPLEKQKQTVRIKDLKFRKSANKDWQRLLKTRLIGQFENLLNSALYNPVYDLGESPVDYLIKNMTAACNMIGIPFNWVKSSSLNLSEKLKGEDRIIEICKLLDCEHYLNSPNGKKLYDRRNFANSGIKLEFLPDFKFDHSSLLIRLLNSEQTRIKNELY